MGDLPSCESMLFIVLLFNVSCDGDLYPVKERVIRDHQTGESNTDQLETGFNPTDSVATETESQPDTETGSSTASDTDVRTGYSACLEKKVCELGKAEIDLTKKCNEGFAFCDILFCEVYGNAKCTPLQSRECFDLHGDLILINTKLRPLSSQFCSGSTFCCMYDEDIVVDQSCLYPSHCGPPEQCIAEGLTPMVASNCPNDSCCMDPPMVYVPLVP